MLNEKHKKMKVLITVTEIKKFEKSVVVDMTKKQYIEMMKNQKMQRDAEHAVAGIMGDADFIETESELYFNKLAPGLAIMTNESNDCQYSEVKFDGKNFHAETTICD